MKLVFVDNNKHVVAALKEAFGNNPEIDVFQDDILSVAKNTVVSPANSFGFMDGGIDKAYTNYFGLDLQRRVTDRIHVLGGKLNVGNAVTVSTGDDVIKYLIVAPTMELPGEVLPVNCYRAMKAILREISAKEDVHAEVYCPGLCTGTGRVDPVDAAGEMCKAYLDWKGATL